MLQIKPLRLDQVIPFPHMSYAPVGRIVYTPHVTGMRVRTSFPDGQAEGLMHIGGPLHGKTTSLRELKNPPTIDVTDMVEIVLDRPSVFSPQSNKPLSGAVFRNEDGSQFKVVTEVLYEGSGCNVDYIIIACQDAAKIGQSSGGLNPELWTGIGEEFDLVWKPEKT